MKAPRVVQDALYDTIHFPEDIWALVATPAVQRLRHVRLSNIDSLSMPGIAGITRFEHVLGTTHLASQLGVARRLERDLLRSLQAALLLHDAAITPFGHLVEEALMYAGAGFHHEDKWSRLAAGEGAELGGADLQLYCGRRAGILDWARQYYGTSAIERIQEIVNTIRGEGRFGPIVSGQIDLDNLDNVTRIAFHMGLRPDIDLPIRLARAIVDCDQEGAVFGASAPAEIDRWLSLREQVYARLMTSPEDFAGKLMLLYATVRAIHSKQLGADSWALSDWEYLRELEASEDQVVVETTRRWLLGDLWNIGALVWMRGKVPEFSELLNFCASLTEATGRECFAYRIKDKRTREFSVRLENGEIYSAGKSSKLWLLCFGSPIRREFTASETTRITKLATEYFGVVAEGIVSSKSQTQWLFDG